MFHPDVDESGHDATEVIRADEADRALLGDLAFCSVPMSPIREVSSPFVMLTVIHQRLMILLCFGPRGKRMSLFENDPNPTELYVSWRDQAEDAVKE